MGVPAYKRARLYPLARISEKNHFCGLYPITLSVCSNSLHSSTYIHTFLQSCGQTLSTRQCAWLQMTSVTLTSPLKVKYILGLCWYPSSSSSSLVFSWGRECITIPYISDYMVHIHRQFPLHPTSPNTVPPLTHYLLIFTALSAL